MAGARAAELKSEQAANAAKMPLSIEQRRASAHAYTDLSSAEAVEVAEDMAPRALVTPGWPEIDLLPGQKLSLDAPNRARITNPNGSIDVAVSTLPLGFPAARGRPWTPTDLDLHAAADGFRADATPVPMTLPARLDNPILVGDGDEQLQIVPDSASAVAGRQQDTGIFYANTATDADLFVKPVLGGVETYDILRSADSPETLSYTIDNPRGGAAPELVADPSRGGFAVMTDAGSIAHISAVKAFDADGRAVPATATADGNRLTLRVPHRGADFAYPITVDPTTIPDKWASCWSYVANHNGCEIDLWETEYNTNYGDGLGAGWSYSETVGGNNTDPHNLISGFFSTNTAYLGMGLTIQERGYNHFDNGEGGNWFLTAPPEVQIYAASFINVTTDNWDNDSCAFTGIRRADLGWNTQPQYVGNCAQQTIDALYVHCTATNCVPGGTATYGNSAWFGSVTNPGSTFGWTNAFTHVLGGVMAFMHDYVAPRLSVVDPGGNQAVQVVLGDFGLGMKRWQIGVNGTVVDRWDDADAAPGCSGGLTRFVCAALRRLHPMASPGLEPGTPRFSVVCSTN